MPKCFLSRFIDVYSPRQMGHFRPFLRRYASSKLTFWDGVGAGVDVDADVEAILTDVVDGDWLGRREKRNRREKDVWEALLSLFPRLRGSR